MIYKEKEIKYLDIDVNAGLQLVVVEKSKRPLRFVRSRIVLSENEICINPFIRRPSLLNLSIHHKQHTWVRSGRLGRGGGMVRLGPLVKRKMCSVAWHPVKLYFPDTDTPDKKNWKVDFSERKIFEIKLNLYKCHPFLTNSIWKLKLFEIELSLRQQFWTSSMWKFLKILE